jgi:hypothetical protein
MIESYQFEHNTDFDTALQRVMASPEGRQLFAKYNQVHCYKVAEVAKPQNVMDDSVDANVDDVVRNRMCAVLQARGGLSFGDALQQVLLADSNLAARYSEYVAATPRLKTRNV